MRLIKEKHRKGDKRKVTSIRLRADLITFCKNQGINLSATVEDFLLRSYNESRKTSTVKP